MRNSVLETDGQTDRQKKSAGVELRFAAKNGKSRGVLELSFQGDFRFVGLNTFLKRFYSKNYGKSV